VTVYGWPYWRAILTITPAAGVVRNPNNGETLPMISLSGFASGTIWLGKSDAFSAHVSRASPPDPGCRQPLRAAIYKGTRLILVKSTWR
jgi:hypothetical protein